MESELYFEDDAMGAYQADRRNLDRLRGLTFKAVEKDPQTHDTIFTFTNKYRHVNVDLIYRGGRMFITDFYGDNMESEKKTFVFFGCYDR